jgi:putative acyl-CoA dehydrogenase
VTTRVSCDDRRATGIMATTAATAPHRTHAVLNQPPPLQDYNVFEAEAALREGLAREGAAWAHPALQELGRLAGTAEAIEWGVQANASPPRLRSHDRYGNRVDEVEFHPAWHRLLEVAVGRGLHASPWREPRAGAHVARAAGFHVWSQVEAGHGCPVSMTFASVPVLRASPPLAEEWLPRVTALAYQPGLRPPGEKGGLLVGMAMTEKQGGSDLRANTTRATPAGDGGHLLTGHKWFCSAPMCDLFLVLAQEEAGLSCFLLPRVLPGGALNAFAIQRLKDKLGNRSNASAEVELDGAWAQRVGEPGRGVRTILEMVNLTRLDCVIGSAALIRQAVAQAIHHATHRAAFGRPLADQPVMQNVLADMAVESEAATTLMLRLAAAADRPQDRQEGAFRRLALAASKYWVCKRAVAVSAEAVECLGGNGYVEESPMPRLYREAPVNSIWEGSGNVNALDALRAASREPDTVEAVCDEAERGRGADPRLDRAIDSLPAQLGEAPDREAAARRSAERLALVLQGSLLVRHAPAAVADAFCASRLGGDWGHELGTLPSGLDLAAIVGRHRPVG